MHLQKIIFDLNYFNKKSLVAPEKNNRFSFSINEKQTIKRKWKEEKN